MNTLVRGQFTLEFKQEAVRLVRGGEAISSVAKTLGMSGQTLHNWVKADAAGKLREVAGKSISAEQMEIARLKAELAKTRMERDILKKRRRILRRGAGLHLDRRHHLSLDRGRVGLSRDRHRPFQPSGGWLCDE